MEPSELARVESLCSQLYSNGENTHLERMEAHHALIVLQTGAQYLPQCRYILEHSSSEYALLFAARSILAIVSKDFKNVPPNELLELRNFLLKRVTDSASPDHFIARSIIHVLCRITRCAWVSNAAQRGIVDDLINMLNSSNTGYVHLALVIVTDLVTEFDQAQSGKLRVSPASGRLSAQAFREQNGLLKCFTASLRAVEMFSSPQSPHRSLLKQALQALLVCLEFDFVGNAQDDSEDGSSCLYLPVEWASHIANVPALQQFFRIYDEQWNVADESEVDTQDDSAATLCLQILTTLAAVRRSVFSTGQRSLFLNEYLKSTSQLMVSRKGLSHNEACLHHLCRLVSQIKNQFQLHEMGNSQMYANWLVAVKDFTKDCYAAWRNVSPRSVFYLTSLWASLVIPIPYLRLRESVNERAGQKADYGLTAVVPEVAAAFLQSRCEMCGVAAVTRIEEQFGSGGDFQVNVENGGFGQGFGGMEDDPLDDEAMLLEELVSFPILARFDYMRGSEIISNLFNEALQRRQSAFSSIETALREGKNISPEIRARLADAQARLAFLTYCIGALVGGNISRVAANCVENLEGLNAELASLVFRMVMETQRSEEAIPALGGNISPSTFGIGSDAGLKLELASLYFIRCFQNLYIESRARDDMEAVESRRRRALGLVEDTNGFLTFTWNRRGSGGGSIRMADSAHSSAAGIISSSSTSAGATESSGSMDVVAGRRNSMELITSSRRPARLPTTMPSLNAMGLIEDHTSQSAGDLETGNAQRSLSSSNDANDDDGMKDSDDGMNEEHTKKASAMQQGIAARLGLPGGDSILLDIAMRRIFGLLQHAHTNAGSNKSNTAQGGASGTAGSSPPTFAAMANLVERALGVLYQLSVGVTIVHAGARYSPRLMYSGRLLLESQVVQELLQNPSAERFPLLLDPRHGRARTFLMATLSKLLYTQARLPSPSSTAIVDDIRSRAIANVDSARAMKLSAEENTFRTFTNFMEPMTDVADKLLALATGGLTPAHVLANMHQPPQIHVDALRNSPDAAVAFIGLCRDLRGVCFSAVTPKEYELILSWICPSRMPLLVAGASAWYNQTEVMAPLLKLVAEIIFSRRNRIVIPQNSAGGLILSREVCRIILAYISPLLEERKLQNSLSAQNDSNAPHGESTNGSLSMEALRDAIMSIGDDDNGSRNGNVITLGPDIVGDGITVDFGPPKMKTARSCLEIVARMLNARLVNVGIMELYGDTLLVDTTRSVLEFAFMGAPTHVMSFTKMSRAIMNVLNKLSEQHILLLVDLKSEVFARMMGCLGIALNSQEIALSTPAGRVIEALAIFRCRAAAQASSSTLPSQLAESNNIIFSGARSEPSVSELRRAAQAFANHELAQPKLFGEFLALCLDRLLTTAPGNEAVNAWCLARPVLPLVLCSPQDFEQYRQSFLSSQSDKRKESIRMELDSLFSKMSPAVTRGADGSIVSQPKLFRDVLRTNDAFTKELSQFARQLKL